ncbi:4-hydroxythreonine-4-phosphate dehydrogenase, partial [bacterium]|nr:4-hydroxythreonine-4-phosphate dehydrogenase [bacterium]
MSATPPLRLAITPGELAGIGPDLVIQLAQQPHDHEWVVIADPDALMARAKTLQLPLNCHPFDANHFRASGLGNISVLAQTATAASPPGEASTDNANYLLKCLDAAIDGCQQQLFSALVTGPLNKHIINAAGIPFSGHTEYLAEKTRCKQVVMMLASEQLRVALLTTHLPLRDVSDAITADSLETVITTLRGELKRYFCTHEPHILVAGLNPHAGEQGSMGREEIDIISPTLSTLRDKGFSLEGP